MLYNFVFDMGYIMYNKFSKFGVLSAVMGFICFGIIYITDSSYPNILFQILTPLFLIFIFVSFIFFTIDWLFELYRCIKNKNYLSTLFWLVIGIFIIYQFIK